MAGSTLFEGLSPDDWRILGNRSERRTFRLGEEIIRPGGFVHHLYIIRQGTVSVELPAAYSTAVLAILKEGDVCGEMAFLGDGIATAAVIAKGVEVGVEAIPVQDLRQLCSDIPGFGFRLYRFLARCLAYRLRSTSAELIRALNLQRANNQGIGPRASK